MRAYSQIKSQGSFAVPVLEGQASVLQTSCTCLKEEIRQSLRLVIKRGAPPIDAVNYKKQILDLFLTHTAKQGTVRRLLLAKLPKGGWRNREQAQYFIGPSAEALTDHSSTSRMLETGLNHANVQLEAQLVAWAQVDGRRCGC